MKLRVGILIITIIAMGTLSWAGFTGKKDVLPFLLSVTLSLSLANLWLGKTKWERSKLLSFALVFAFISVGVGTIQLLVK